VTAYKKTSVEFQHCRRVSITEQYYCNLMLLTEEGWVEIYKIKIWQLKAGKLVWITVFIKSLTFRLN
jgi:hypothetical protein